MKKILSEALAVNLIIILMLTALAAYSQKSISAFANERQAVYKAETTEKTVALMINVYQGNEYIEEMLEIFARESIKATFFIGGCWAKKNAETLSLISEAGHELGNHGYNHKLHTKLTREQSQSEISRTNSLIKEVTGKTCVLFAPPSGDVNESVVSDAAVLGCDTVMWTIDTIDWRDADTDKIFSRIERNLCPGALILMHPTAATAEALPRIIQHLRNNGYSTATVSELLK